MLGFKPNLGIAGGAWAGGLITSHFGLIHTAWVGALVVLIALGITHVECAFGQGSGN